MAVVHDTTPVPVRWRAGGRTQPRLRGWLHLCTVPMAVIATVVLIGAAPNATARVGAAIYGGGVCALFTVSALYHRVRWYEVAHLRMRRLDHGTIFLMIAGTYTPLCLLASTGAMRVVLLSVIWLVAASGFLVSVSGMADDGLAKAGCYVVLASIGVVALPQLVVQLDGWQLLLIVAGVALYAVGALCLATGRPDPFPATFGYHEIWHALVWLACAFQYVAILSLVRAAS